MGHSNGSHDGEDKIADTFEQIMAEVDLGPEWDTEKPSTYSVTTFYTQASDSLGHSGGQIRTQFTKEILGQVSKLIASGRVPQYSVPQDFVRDAVVHRLHQLENIVRNDLEWIDETRRIIRDMTFETELRRMTEHVKFQQTLLETLRDTFTCAFMVNDLVTARLALAKAEAHCAGDLAQPWQGRFEDLTRLFRSQLAGR